MNRTYFWILTCLSSLITILIILQIVLIFVTSSDQSRLQTRQLVVTDGQAYDEHVRQVATRIYQVAQQKNDQQLKDLLVRQELMAPSTSANATNTEPAAVPNPTPAPAPH